MAQCTSCGCDTTFLTGAVECVQQESYELNQPNGQRRDTIGRKVWNIALCRICATRRLEEAVRGYRRFALLYGPGCLAGGVLGGLVFIPVLAKIRSPGLSLTTLAMFGIVALFGLIAIPVGLLKAMGSTRRLKRIMRQGENFGFGDEDRGDSLRREGERILKCLESKQVGFHGEFALPQGRARNRGMGKSLVYYVIEEKI